MRSRNKTESDFGGNYFGIYLFHFNTMDGEFLFFIYTKKYLII